MKLKLKKVLAGVLVGGLLISGAVGFTSQPAEAGGGLHGYAFLNNGLDGIITADGDYSDGTPHSNKADLDGDGYTEPYKIDGKYTGMDVGGWYFNNGYEYQFSVTMPEKPDNGLVYGEIIDKQTWDSGRQEAVEVFIKYYDVELDRMRGVAIVTFGHLEAGSIDKEVGDYFVSYADGSKFTDEDSIIGKIDPDSPTWGPHIHTDIVALGDEGLDYVGNMEKPQSTLDSNVDSFLHYGTDNVGDEIDKGDPLYYFY